MKKGLTILLKAGWFNRYIYPGLKTFVISLLTFGLIYLEPSIQGISTGAIFLLIVACFSFITLAAEKFERYLKELRFDDIVTATVKTYGLELFNNNYEKFRITLFEEGDDKYSRTLKIFKRLNGQISDTVWRIDGSDLNNCEGVAGRAWFWETKVLTVKLKPQQTATHRASRLFMSDEKFQARSSDGKMNPESIIAKAIKMKDGTKMVLVIDTLSTTGLPKNSSVTRLADIIKTLMEEL